MDKLEQVAPQMVVKTKKKKCCRKKMAALQDSVITGSSGGLDVYIRDGDITAQRFNCREHCYIVQDFSNNSSKISTTMSGW